MPLVAMIGSGTGTAVDVADSRASTEAAAVTAAAVVAATLEAEVLPRDKAGCGAKD
jgi:hypothetical protein